MTSFLSTSWPWLLVLVLAACGLWGERVRARRLLQWFSPAALQHQGVEPGRRRLPFAIGLVGIFALAMALKHWSQPPTGTVWLLIDASRSMAVVEADGRTRWQQAAPTLAAWARNTPRPVAIIAFQRQAWLVIPPTQDRDALAQTLSTWQPRPDAQGSDPHAALALMARLSSPDDAGVLVSDGEWDDSKPAPLSPVAALACGDPQGGAVPRIAGDPPGPLMSMPNPDRLSALTAGRVMAVTAVTPKAIDALLSSEHRDARRWAVLGLILVSVEVLTLLRRRYRLATLSLPYAWIQRYANWRLRGTASLILLLTLTGATPAWESQWRTRPSPARGPYDQGVQALAAGNRQAAEAAWREAIRLDPAWQPAWYNLGTLLAAMPEKRQTALWALERAVALDPGDPWAQGNLQALQRRPLGAEKPLAMAGTATKHSPAANPSSQDGLTGIAAGPSVDMASTMTAAPDQPTATGQSMRPGSESRWASKGDERHKATDDTPSMSSTSADGANGVTPGTDEAHSTGPLSAAEIDQLLETAERLSDTELGNLKAEADRQASGQREPLPRLSPEQMRRVLDLAARIPVSRQPPASPLETSEPAQGSSTLRW